MDIIFGEYSVRKLIEYLLSMFTYLESAKQNKTNNSLPGVTFLSGHCQGAREDYNCKSTFRKCQFFVPS